MVERKTELQRLVKKLSSEVVKVLEIPKSSEKKK